MKELEKQYKYSQTLLLSMIMAIIMTIFMTGSMSITSFAADHDIVVLYTNDVHCGVDDKIGYAGLALYKKQMQKETPYVALADAGDAIQGAPIGTLSEGEYLVDIMNYVGYDFAIPGNHEFDYGMSRFLDLAGKMKCGYYSSNFTDLRTGNLVFPGYKIMTYGDTKLAFVGVTTPETFTKSTPKYFQDAQGNYIYGFSEDNDGSSLYAHVQSSVDAARAEGADIVILVGHLGENGVTSRWSSDSVIAHTSGIDICIDGHSHETYVNKMVKNSQGQEVLLTQTGTKLEHIGKLVIKTDGSYENELVDVVNASAAATYTVQNHDTLSRIAKRELGNYELWSVIYDANRDRISNPNSIKPGMVLTIPSAVQTTDANAVDPETNEMIKGIQAQYAETLKTVLGNSDVDLTANDAATGERRVRSGETNLGDFCADAFRQQTGADIGLMNGGGIRSSLKAGNITYNDMLTVFPYGNMVCVINVTGQQIKDALEMGARALPEESGGFLQVSGLTYEIDSTVPSSVQRDDKGNFTGVTGAYRVKNITVGGAPLDLGKTYSVVSHEYMLKNGGDGMTMFKKGEIIRDNIYVDIDALSGYMTSLSGTKLSTKYGNPAGSGRITIK